MADSASPLGVGAAPRLVVLGARRATSSAVPQDWAYRSSTNREFGPLVNVVVSVSELFVTDPASR